MTKSPETGLLKRVLFGMIGGAAGTWLMGKVTTAMYKYESEDVKKREAELMKEPAYAVFARRIAEKAGFSLTDDQARRAGSVLHWGYGITWGGIYGAMHEHVPAMGRAAGLPYGVTVFVVGDEGFNAAMHTAPPPGEFPFAVHLRGLVGHIVYAATLSGVYRLLSR